MDNAEETPSLDELALGTAQVLMDSFRGFGEHDELWPTIGFSGRAQAQARWVEVIHTTLTIAVEGLGSG